MRIYDCMCTIFCIILSFVVIYLLQESLEYQIGQDGKTISLIEDLGIIVDIPHGAIPSDHPNDVIIKINTCVSGPFELPDGFELASPVYHIEPGVKFAEKLIELSMVHFINIKDVKQCSELMFISAPPKQSCCQSEDEGKGTIMFKCLDGGVFWPGRRMGKISLQHFCFIGIVQLLNQYEKVEDTTKSSSAISLQASRNPIGQFMHGYVIGCLVAVL